MRLFNKKLNILVLGSDGMLGYDVFNDLNLRTYQNSSIINRVVGLNRQEMEKEYFFSGSCSMLENFFKYHRHFDYCINCVAMTDTASAENTMEGRRLSYELNAGFPCRLAKACHKNKTKLIHISTDYVFSEYCNVYNNGGQTADVEVFPKNIYGTHKLIGELLIKEAMKPKEYSILRTSWLYGSHNSKSFVHKFIKNALECTKDNKPIEVTSDEFSVPTNTGTLVDQINIVLNNNVYGVRHVVDDWEHPVSRLEFAKNIAATYNDIIKDNHLNQPQINEELIVGVERPDKLQPTVSCMYSTCCTSWENKLYMFLKKYLIELEEHS